MQGIDILRFSGDQEMNTTAHATAISDQTVAGDKRAVRITATDHGFKTGTNIFLQGFTNYNGGRLIDAVGTDTIDVLLGSDEKFVAETPVGDGTEMLRPGFQFDGWVEFLGFKLHLDAASATSENLVCSVDSHKGAAWDVNFYTKDMNTIQDVVNFFDIPIPIHPKDIVYFTWANSNDTLWGLEVHTRRI